MYDIVKIYYMNNMYNFINYNDIDNLKFVNFALP